MQPMIVHPAGTDWVLVQGHHDSGTIAGVFGPYTEEHADWLIATMLDCSTYNWTKAKLQNGPKPEAASQRLQRLAEPGE